MPRRAGFAWSGWLVAAAVRAATADLHEAWLPTGDLPGGLKQVENEATEREASKVQLRPKQDLDDPEWAEH